MIAQQSLLQELRGVAGLVFSSLLTIVVTTTLIRTLGRTAAGRTDPELILPLLALSSLSSLPLVLSLTAMIAGLIVLSRMWKDSEMVIWMAAGRSQTDVVRTLLRFVLPLVVLTALASVVLTPWARQQTDVLKQRITASDSSSALSTGQFRETRSGDRLIFAERPDPDLPELGLVFVLDRSRQASERVLIAASGSFSEQTAEDPSSTGEQRPTALVRNGTQTDLPPLRGAGHDTGLSVRQMLFSEYEVALEVRPPAAPVDPQIRSQTADQLLARWGPWEQGELANRLSAPMLCLLFGLLAVPLARSTPRMGRSLQMVAALLIVVIAQNLTGIAQAWVSQSRVDFWTGLFGIPALLLAIFVVLMWIEGGGASRLRHQLRRVLRAVPRAQEGSRHGA